MGDTYTNFGLTTLALSCLGVIALSIYRLVFHPLSHIPGPRIAALTGWYEFYHDVICGGTYVKNFPRLHSMYGPVIRISPDHVHVNEPAVHKRIFGPKEEFKKSPHFYATVGVPNSMLSITDRSAHRARRNVLNPAFTPQAIASHAGLVGLAIEKSMVKMDEYRKDGRVLNIQRLYRAVTLDMICKSLFGGDLGLVDGDEENPAIVVNIEVFLQTMWTMKHLPFLNKIALNLPMFLAEIVLPGYASFRKHCKAWISYVQRRREKGVYTDESGASTVFDLLLAGDAEASPSKAKNEEMIDDAFVSLIAGSESTTLTLAYATYYLLRDQEKLQKLRDELCKVPRNKNGILMWEDVHDLPYLGAVIKETLRIAPAVPGCLPRIVPEGGIQVGSTFIPGGSIISVSETLIHFNKDSFVDPGNFFPERWLAADGKDLEQWLVPFSKGPRQCVGKNLAYLQLYMCLANILDRFDMDLYETDEKSMEWKDPGFLTNRSQVKVIVNGQTVSL